MEFTIFSAAQPTKKLTEKATQANQKNQSHWWNWKKPERKL